MAFAPAYVLGRFFFRIADFFHHWYAHGSRAWGHAFVGTLEDLDRTFALKITLRHFFDPLYGDYSIIGRILGIVFRTVRVAIAGAVYACLAAAFGVAYVAWLAVPLSLLAYAWGSF